MKLLPILLATLVVANDDAEKASGGLRGTKIQEENDQERRKAQWLINIKRPDVFPLIDLDALRGKKPVLGIFTPEPTEAPVVSTIAPFEPTIPPVAAVGVIERPTIPLVEPAEDPVAAVGIIERPTIPLVEPAEAPVAAVGVIERPPSNPPTEAPVVIANRPTIDGLLPTPPPITQTPPIREENLDINGNTCGMSTDGTVILHGGIFNYDDPLSDSLGQAIVREMRTNSQNRIMDPLAFIPGARRDVTEQDEIEFENQWRNIMAPGVAFTVLHSDDVEPNITNVADAALADTDDFVRPLKDAMGVFLPGGRQHRIIDAYKYTKTEEEMWNVLKRGGVIAGTSAGAAAMASFMPRGDPAGSARMIAEREWYQHGFGFVSNIAIDNHVSSRGRENAMYEVFNDRLENRKLLGIGLNENTMVIVKGRYFQVRGDSGPDSVARVYDCSGINEFDTCSYQNAPYLNLTQGNWYDLCARQQMSGPPSLNDQNEDLGRRVVQGAYDRRWTFGNDFKSGNPHKFLCSGRRCIFQSNPIVVDSQDGNVVRITGRVYSEGVDISDSLKIRYRIGEDPEWRSAFDTVHYPPTSSSPLGRVVYYAFPIPNGKSEVHIEIDAETGVEGEAEFQVRDLKIA